MTIPFLHRLPVLAGSRLRQVLMPGDGPRAEAAKAALHHLLVPLPDLLLALVVDVRSGLLLASYSTERHFHLAAITTSAVLAVRQLQAGSQAQLGPATEQLHEVLLTLPSQLHLTRLGTDGHAALYLVVDAYDTNLAIARQVAQQAMHHFDILS